MITADGDPAGAEYVRVLVQSAPAVPGWTPRAFKPRLDVSGCVARVGTVTITPDDIEYAVVDIENPAIGKQTLLIVFVEGFEGEHAAEVEMAAHQLLQSVLGEERVLSWNYLMEDSVNCAEKLAGIERTPLPQIIGILEKLDVALAASDKQ